MFLTFIPYFIFIMANENTPINLTNMFCMQFMGIKPVLYPLFWSPGHCLWIKLYFWERIAVTSNSQFFMGRQVSIMHEGDHLFSAYAKLCGKLIFLTCVCISGVNNFSFSESPNDPEQEWFECEDDLIYFRDSICCGEYLFLKWS